MAQTADILQMVAPTADILQMMAPTSDVMQIVAPATDILYMTNVRFLKQMAFAILFNIIVILQ